MYKRQVLAFRNARLGDVHRELPAVGSTDNVLESAIAHGVKNVVVLSTDKAAYPINAMGISLSLIHISAYCY